MFTKWMETVFSGCVSDWDYALCLLLLLLFFDVLCSLIDMLGRGSRG